MQGCGVAVVAWEGLAGAGVSILHAGSCELLRQVAGGFPEEKNKRRGDGSRTVSADVRWAGRPVPSPFPPQGRRRYASVASEEQSPGQRA